MIAMKNKIETLFELDDIIKKLKLLEVGDYSPLTSNHVTVAVNVNNRKKIEKITFLFTPKDFSTLY